MSVASEGPTQLRRYITIQQAAEQLGCSVRTIHRRIRAGELSAFRLGKRAVRVPADEVESLLTPRRADGAA